MLNPKTASDRGSSPVRPTGLLHPKWYQVAKNHCGKPGMKAETRLFGKAQLMMAVAGKRMGLGKR